MPSDWKFNILNECAENAAEKKKRREREKTRRILKSSEYEQEHEKGRWK